jgi:hypothetical protein
MDISCMHGQMSSQDWIRITQNHTLKSKLQSRKGIPYLILILYPHHITILKVYRTSIVHMPCARATRKLHEAALDECVPMLRCYSSDRSYLWASFCPRTVHLRSKDLRLWLLVSKGNTYWFVKFPLVWRLRIVVQYPLCRCLRHVEVAGGRKCLVPCIRGWWQGMCVEISAIYQAYVGVV